MLTSLLLITLYAITLHIIKSDMPTTSRPSLSTVNISLPTDQQLIDSINTYCDTAVESLDLDIEALLSEPEITLDIYDSCLLPSTTTTTAPKSSGRKTNAWHAEQMDNTLTLSAGSIDMLKAMLEALPIK